MWLKRFRLFLFIGIDPWTSFVLACKTNRKHNQAWKRALSSMNS